MLKSPWENHGSPTPDPAGDLITSRGGDPNISTGGTSGLNELWENAPVPTPGGSETENSVSGMPTTPSRWQPSGTPPAPPSLKDRNPGTIDER